MFWFYALFYLLIGHVYIITATILYKPFRNKIMTGVEAVELSTVTVFLWPVSLGLYIYYTVTRKS